MGNCRKYRPPKTAPNASNANSRLRRLLSSCDMASVTTRDCVTKNTTVAGQATRARGTAATERDAA